MPNPHLSSADDNPFWVGPSPAPQIPVSTKKSHSSGIPRSPTSQPLDLPKDKAKKVVKKERPRPSLDQSDDNPFLTRDNPFLSLSTSKHTTPVSSGIQSVNKAEGSGSGSGSRSFLRKMKEVGTSRPRSSLAQGDVSVKMEMEIERWSSPCDTEVDPDVVIQTRSPVTSVNEPLVPRARVPVGSTVQQSEKEEVVVKTETLDVEVKTERVEVIPSPRRTRAGGKRKAGISYKEAKMEMQSEEECKVVAPAKKPRISQRPPAKARAPSKAKAKEKVKLEDQENTHTRVKVESSSMQAGPSTSALPPPPISGIDLDMGEKKPKMDLKEQAKGKGKGKAKEVVPAGEVRAGRWRKACPKSTLERLDRVMHQRMFLLDRSERPGDSLVGLFKVLGSTGNVYTVRTGPFPSCDCPDAGKGNIPCKHIIFVFIKVLKLPPSSELWYQKSLLDSELKTIYQYAPPAAFGSYQVPEKARAAYLRATRGEPEEAEPSTSENSVKVDPDENPKRKEATGEDCPVCYEEMSDEDVKKGQLVWDESDMGCGKALHKECFRNWTASLITKGADITCVWCRCAWPAPSGGRESTLTKGANGNNYTSAGYMNMAELAGVSRVRDTSTYYQGPIRGRAMWEPRYLDD